MPERRVIPEPLATRTPPIPAQQVGRHAAFIEEDILTDIAERLPLAPPPTLSGNVGPALFVGVYGFF